MDDADDVNSVNPWVGKVEGEYANLTKRSLYERALREAFIKLRAVQDSPSGEHYEAYRLSTATTAQAWATLALATAPELGLT